MIKDEAEYNSIKRQRDAYQKTIEAFLEVSHMETQIAAARKIIEQFDQQLREYETRNNITPN